MIINGKNVAVYYESHSLNQLHTVVQTLKYFGLHRDLELFIKRRIAAEMSETGPQDGLVRHLRPTDTKCPDCGSDIVGVKMPFCEAMSSGRKWYEECTACSYYREEFGGVGHGLHKRRAG